MAVTPIDVHSFDENDERVLVCEKGIDIQLINYHTDGYSREVVLPSQTPIAVINTLIQKYGKKGWDVQEVRGDCYGYTIPCKLVFKPQEMADKELSDRKIQEHKSKFEELGCLGIMLLGLMLGVWVVTGFIANLVTLVTNSFK